MNGQHDRTAGFSRAPGDDASASDSRATRFLRCARSLLGLSLLAVSGAAPAVSIFSAGMTTPESISEVPSGFGALGGDFLVPDAADGLPTSTYPEILHGRIWRVPAAGGAPSVLVDIQDARTLGGLFLPDTAAWSANAGKYLVTGVGPPGPAAVPVDVPKLFVVDASGSVSELVTLPSNGVFLTTPVIAPSTFGSLGDSLLVAAQSSGILTVAPDGTIGSLVGADPAHVFFGLTFAPSGFGAVGGTLLASVAGSGDIWSVQPDGDMSLFTSVEVFTDQGGGRQMTFAPGGFLTEIGIDDEVLLISISDRSTGGGTLGDVLAVDATGATVASLRTAGALDKFDPRGLLVTSSGELLISDTSDPIIVASGSDFRPGRDANAVPEPSTVPLATMALVLVSMMRRRVSARASMPVDAPRPGTPPTP